MFTCVLGRCVASTVSLIPNSFGKECPFSGVTNSGRVWRKVLESEAVCELHIVIPGLAILTSYWSQRSNDQLYVI